MYEIRYRKAALKALMKLEALRQPAEDADRVKLDIKALQGRDGFRLRVGQWRVIYHKHNNEVIILTVDAGSKGDIYK